MKIKEPAISGKQRLAHHIIEADNSAVQDMEMTANESLDRYYQDNFLTLSSTIPMTEITEHDWGCEERQGPHSHIITFIDVDVEMLKADLAKFCERKLAPFTGEE